MIISSSSVIWLFITFSLALFLWVLTSNKTSSKSRPPGPPRWPLIGNIFDAGMMPHQNFYKLRAKYGPVLWLKLGMSNTLVVQSAKAAEQLFKKNDYVFSDRMVPDSLTACGYNNGSLAVAHQGEYCRVVRKLSVSELFTTKRIASSAAAREACVDLMIRWITDDANESRLKRGTGEVYLEKYPTLMTFNLVSNFLISKDVMDTRSGKGSEFCEAMEKFMEWNGVPNLADSFPFLKRVDPQGIRRNTGKYLGQILNIIEGFVNERIQEKLDGKYDNDSKDFLDSLLEYEGKGEITEISKKNVTIVVTEMFFGGTETTSSTIIWGMAELLRKPEWLKKIKEEIDQVVGHSRKVQEAELINLPYLQAVVKETMRLHPALPFLLPRNAIEDTEFMGYFIPKDTIVILNAWAIHRDPDSWEDPLSFNPERFMNSNVESKGQHFQFIPFGSGRRSCIGMLLGDKMVGLTLARLVQSFDWSLLKDSTAETMDMREQMGIALRKLMPLAAVPTQRKS